MLQVTVDVSCTHTRSTYLQNMHGCWFFLLQCGTAGILYQSLMDQFAGALHLVIEDSCTRRQFSNGRALMPGVLI